MLVVSARMVAPEPLQHDADLLLGREPSAGPPVDLANERPSSREVLDATIAAFRQHAGDLAVRAVGICTDSHILMPDGIRESDAISVHLEHRNGEAVVVFLPYDKPLMGAIRYEQEWSLDDRLGLRYGAQRGFHPYDGVREYANFYNLSLNWRF